MTRRQTASIVFVVLCVVLVAAAVTLNIGWILANGRQRRAARARRHRLRPDHRRHHRLHGVPRPRDGHHRTARQLPQLGHARAEDADRVDSPVPGDAAVARRRRRAAQGVLPDHAGGRRPAAAHRGTGAEGRRTPGRSRKLHHRAPVDLAWLVRRMRRHRAACATTCRPSAITMADVDPNALLVVDGDVDELRTAIANLLDNAVKYSSAARRT